MTNAVDDPLITSMVIHRGRGRGTANHREPLVF